MKKSVILSIFHGSMGHMETMQMPKEHENNKNSDKICGVYDELKEKLSPELWKLQNESVIPKIICIKGL